MIRLRGHHLVCLHYYHGDGITEAYAVHLRERVERAQQGEKIIVARGADDICEACPHLQESLCQGNTAEEEEIQKLDQQALALLKCQVGDMALWDDIRHQVESAEPSWFESFCYGCTWVQYCDRGRKKCNTEGH